MNNIISDYQNYVRRTFQHVIDLLIDNQNTLRLLIESRPEAAPPRPTYEIMQDIVPDPLETPAQLLQLMQQLNEDSDMRHALVSLHSILKLYESYSKEYLN